MNRASNKHSTDAKNSISALLFAGVAGAMILCAAPDTASAQPGGPTCSNFLQNKVAWDYKGSKRWSPSNLNRLCKNTADAQAARCFKRVMHGNVNYGGGTKWKWENAIDLCEQSDNANRTISCFRNQIKRGKQWKQAVAKCDERAPRPNCKTTLQNKVAWDYKGSKRWSPTNLNRLCKNVRGNQPALCFKRVMHGNVNYGGGTKWKWENAIDLCEGSRSANRTISCFKNQIKRGKKWKQAIQSCGR